MISVCAGLSCCGNLVDVELQLKVAGIPPEKLNLCEKRVVKC